MGCKFWYSEAMLKRIRLDPGLPAVNPTVAPWQTPPHHLGNVTSACLPHETDVVLIGTGITACAVAHAILTSAAGFSKKPRVVALEARSLCSGASGRNGGHLRDSPVMYFGFLKDKYGLESAKRMTRFRSSHVQEIINLARQEGLYERAEFQPVEAVDVFFDESKWEQLKDGFLEYEKEMPLDDSNRPKILEKEEARNTYQIPKAVAALSYPALTHSTYQLVCGLFSNLFDRYRDQLSIETSTPVESISTLEPSLAPYSFEVKTPRGNIKTRHVVHCTNSHAGHLLPGLRGKIIPIRDLMTEQSYEIPRNEDGKERSWIFFWEKGVDYMINRQGDTTRSPALLLGGGLSHSADDGMDEVGRSLDDDKDIPTEAYLHGLLPSMFAGKRNTDMKSSWTGILGWSADLLPWVGQVPSSVSTRVPPASSSDISDDQENWEKVDGREWLSAAYSGEGMTLAWRCGEVVAYRILNIDQEMKVDDWFPKEYELTEKRVAEADVRKLKELY